MSDVETRVKVWIRSREAKHAELMRLADDYADESRRQQVGMPSRKRSELYDAVWKALGLA